MERGRCEHAATGSVNERPEDGSGPSFMRGPSDGAGVIVLDVTSLAKVLREATFSVPGDINDSRMIGSILYLATSENASCWRCGARPSTRVTGRGGRDPRWGQERRGGNGGSYDASVPVSRGGCSTAGGGPRGGTWAGLGLLAAVVAAGMRRRRDCAEPIA